MRMERDNHGEILKIKIKKKGQERGMNTGMQTIEWEEKERRGEGRESMFIRVRRVKTFEPL